MNERRYERARYRALSQLAREHPQEYERLLAEALASDDAELLGWQVVTEHKRRIFGKRDDLAPNDASKL